MECASVCGKVYFIKITINFKIAKQNAAGDAVLNGLILHFAFRSPVLNFAFSILHFAIYFPVLNFAFSILHFAFYFPFPRP